MQNMLPRDVLSEISMYITDINDMIAFRRACVLFSKLISCKAVYKKYIDNKASIHLSSYTANRFKVLNWLYEFPEKYLSTCFNFDSADAHILIRGLRKSRLYQLVSPDSGQCGSVRREYMFLLKKMTDKQFVGIYCDKDSEDYGVIFIIDTYPTYYTAHSSCLDIEKIFTHK